MTGFFSKRVGWVVISLGLLLFPNVAYQQIVPCNPSQGSVRPGTTSSGGVPTFAFSKGGNNCDLLDLLSIPARIFQFLLQLAGALLLGVIVVSGLRIMMFYLSDGPEAELSSAKQMLKNGLVGFTIVVGAYLIVYLVVVTLFEVGGGNEIGAQIRAVLGL